MSGAGGSAAEDVQRDWSARANASLLVVAAAAVIVAIWLTLAALAIIWGIRVFKK